ncbi:MAG TPA: YbaB/EbfC family nucleoid-associated protein [Candidatus Dormibacteraeota bacterium]|nr:YbaB/EbfC family nucleoid-associated protein [Candidatus Dormibacteraeota bacterium]
MMNPANMMAQVKKMQAEMLRVQEELAATVVCGSAAAGAVRVEMTCDQRVKSVKIDPQAIDPGDVETLEDLIVVATNDALQRVGEESQKRMNAVTGGMRIPGLS